VDAWILTERGALPFADAASTSNPSLIENDRSSGLLAGAATGFSARHSVQAPTSTMEAAGAEVETWSFLEVPLFETPGLESLYSQPAELASRAAFDEAFGAAASEFELPPATSWVDSKQGTDGAMRWLGAGDTGLLPSNEALILRSLFSDSAVALTLLGALLESSGLKRSGGRDAGRSAGQGGWSAKTRRQGMVPDAPTL
jgi:hypothetical protein